MTKRRRMEMIRRRIRKNEMSNWVQQWSATRFPSIGLKSKIDGVVYFLECGEFIKIGFSSEVRSRIKSLQTSNPHEIKLLATIQGDLALEVALHERFQKHHHRLEWFRKDKEILDYIAEAA